jgi:hypothetical protein
MARAEPLSMEGPRMFVLDARGMLIALMAGTCAVATLSARAVADRSPEVLAEETVYTYEPANNGAGPLWCYGSTCIVRVRGDVFVSGLETIRGAKPLNNTRWVLHRRGPAGWQVLQRDETGRTREPCPIAALGDGSLLLSANPTLTPRDTYGGPARPEVLRFRAGAPSDPPQTLAPTWVGTPPFTEHSYRGFCADATGRTALLMNVEGHVGQHWSLLDRSGQWAANGKLTFPMGTDYPVPEPIRLCYPVLALRGRSAHMLAISDIIEPIPEWRAFKKQLTGNDWDYEFRRLFYVWAPDLEHGGSAGASPSQGGFGEPVEVASREKTCGHITNLDIWLERPDRAHLLWLERSVWYPQMRDRFFPGTPLTVSLEHAVVERGKVVSRATLAKGGEGAEPVAPGYARFHASARGKLHVVAYFSGTDAQGRSVSENRLMALSRSGKVERSWRIPLAHPFTAFMTATERAGSPRSDVLDLLGTTVGKEGISYAAVRLP